MILPPSSLTCVGLSWKSLESEGFVMKIKYLWIFIESTFQVTHHFPTFYLLLWRSWIREAEKKIIFNFWNFRKFENDQKTIKKFFSRKFSKNRNLKTLKNFRKKLKIFFSSKFSNFFSKVWFRDIYWKPSFSIFFDNFFA